MGHNVEVAIARDTATPWVGTSKSPDSPGTPQDHTEACRGSASAACCSIVGPESQKGYLSTVQSGRQLGDLVSQTLVLCDQVLSDLNSLAIVGQEVRAHCGVSCSEIGQSEQH